MKSVRIQSFSGPYFPAFGLNMERYGRSISPYSVHMRENRNQRNCEYGLFSCSVYRFSFMFNPFVSNAPFLYPLKTSEKPYGFLMFSRGREMIHWEQMG